MVTLTVRISDELNAAIEEFCKVEDRSKSWLIKKAIQEKLERWQNSHPSHDLTKKLQTPRSAHSENL